jgi:hypothetical protein
VRGQYREKDCPEVPVISKWFDRRLSLVGARTAFSILPAQQHRRNRGGPNSMAEDGDRIRNAHSQRRHREKRKAYVNEVCFPSSHHFRVVSRRNLLNCLLLAWRIRAHVASQLEKTVQVLSAQLESRSSSQDIPPCSRNTSKMRCSTYS